MKKYLYIFAGLLVAGCSGEKPGEIHLHGQLIDMGSQHVTLKYDGASSWVGNSRNITLITDANGFFDTVLPLDKPTYYSISRNTMYLSPGDDLKVYITTRNTEAEFSGEGSVANNYMKYRLFPKGGSFLEAGGNVREDFTATRFVVDSLATVRRAQLEGLEGVSREFKDLENARITADVVNSYFTYRSYSRKARTMDAAEADAYRKEHSNNLKDIIPDMLRELSHDRYLDVAVVRDVLSYSKDDPYGWFDGVDLSERTRELYTAGDLSYRLDSQMDPEKMIEVESEVQALTQDDFRAELTQKITKASRLFRGRPAPDFTISDTEGNDLRVSDFKGKVIYLDFWATWCGPCIAESPYFEALAGEMKGEDVVFLAISTDSQRKVWEEYLAQHHKTLPQYHTTDTGYAADWSIKFIPRFIVIDRDFNIADAYAPRPSQPEAKELLRSLL